MARTAASYQETVSEINKSGGKAIGINADATDPNSLDTAFNTLKQEFPDHKLAAVVFNPSSGYGKKPFMEIDPEDMTKAVNANILGFFNFARKVLPLLEESVPSSPHPPTLIVTGATASVRGSNQFAVFATGMWGKRGLTQSLAREYGPKGVHVAHAVIDGMIDIPRTEGLKPNGGAPDGKISPDSVSTSLLGFSCCKG